MSDMQERTFTRAIKYVLNVERYKRKNWNIIFENLKVNIIKCLSNKKHTLNSKKVPKTATEIISLKLKQAAKRLAR